MRLETRENISKQGAEIASLAESWGNGYYHVKYLQKRIADMEEKLSNVQNTLAEIEYSEEIDWLGKLNE